MLRQKGVKQGLRVQSSWIWHCVLWHT